MARCSIRCFGVGSGFPTADRGHSAFLYRLGSESLLIDCGDGLSARYEAAGISYDQFGSLILSHQHGDHVGGFLMFLQAMWLRQRQRKLEVRVGADGLDVLRRMSHAAYLFPELFNFDLKWATIRAGHPFKAGKVRVTPQRTTHLESFVRRFGAKYRLTFDAFSFLLEHGRTRIAHSADLGTPSDLEPLLRKPVTALVCELAHFTPDDLFDYLAGRAIGKLVLVHLIDRYWEDRRTILQHARRALPKTKCVIAKPGEEITL